MLNSTKFKVFVSLRSPFARRVRLTLTRVGIPFEEEIIDVFNPPSHFLALNPLGLVPTLVGPSGFVLSDSSMILEWAQVQTGRVYSIGAREWPERQASVLCEGVIQSTVLFFQETHMHEAPSPGWAREHSGVIAATLNTIEAMPRELFISAIGVGSSLGGASRGAGSASRDGGTGGSDFAGEELTQAGWDLAVALEYLTLRLPTYDWSRLHSGFNSVMKFAQENEKFVATVPPVPT